MFVFVSLHTLLYIYSCPVISPFILIYQVYYSISVSHCFSLLSASCLFMPELFSWWYASCVSTSSILLQGKCSIKYKLYKLQHPIHQTKLYCAFCHIIIFRMNHIPVKSNTELFISATNIALVITNTNGLTNPSILVPTHPISIMLSTLDIDEQSCPWSKISRSWTHKCFFSRFRCILSLIDAAHIIHFRVSLFESYTLFAAKCRHAAFKPTVWHNLSPVQHHVVART